MHDLVLTNGRILDPGSGLDCRGDVAFSSGRIAALGPSGSEVNARRVVDVNGAIIAPGLIDIHTHVYWGATYLSVDANAVARTGATTTLVDAGSSGAATFAGSLGIVLTGMRVEVLGS